MTDGFTIPVQMDGDEAAWLYERAIAATRPRIAVSDEYGVLGDGTHRVSIDDLRVVFEYDEDNDWSYIEQFDNEAEYNEWSEREGALNSRTYFQSMRPETRQFDGLPWEPYRLPREYPWHTDENGVVHTQTIKRWMTTGQYYAVKFATHSHYRNGRDENDPRHGAVRLAHKSEIHETYDEYRDGHGNLNNYVSFYVKLEVCTERSIDGDETWEAINGIGGCDFYERGGDDIPYADEPYTLHDLKHKEFRSFAEDYFGIDFSKVPD